MFRSTLPYTVPPNMHCNESEEWQYKPIFENFWTCPFDTMCFRSVHVDAFEVLHLYDCSVDRPFADPDLMSLYSSL